MIGGITVISPGPVEEMRAEVLRHAFRAMGLEEMAEVAADPLPLQRAG
jgi:hypothetical protein